MYQISHIMKNIIAIILFALSLSGYAQNATTPYYFSNLNVEDGLSNNSVNVILQDIINKITI